MAHSLRPAALPRTLTATGLAALLVGAVATPAAALSGDDLLSADKSELSADELEELEELEKAKKEAERKAKKAAEEAAKKAAQEAKQTTEKATNTTKKTTEKAKKTADTATEQSPSDPPKKEESAPPSDDKQAPADDTGNDTDDEDDDAAAGGSRDRGATVALQGAALTALKSAPNAQDRVAESLRSAMAGSGGGSGSNHPLLQPFAAPPAGSGATATFELPQVAERSTRGEAAAPQTATAPWQETAQSFTSTPASSFANAVPGWMVAAASGLLLLVGGAHAARLVEGLDGSTTAT